MSFHNYFPVGYTPNIQQDFILSELDKAKDNGYKFIIINAMTGTGKSMIAKTIANSINEPSQGFTNFVKTGAIYELEEEDMDSIKPEGTSILTMTKTLQNQYYDLFPDGDLLKGKSNYECYKTDGLSCDLGPCVLNMNFGKCPDCPYYMARDAAVASACSFYSYSMFLSLPIACRAKVNLVCDEASELEDMLVRAYSVNFDFKLLKKLKIDYPSTPIKGSDYEDYVIWAMSVKNEIRDALDDIKTKFRKKGKKAPTKEEKTKYRILNLLHEGCNELVNSLKTTEYIFEHTKSGIIYKPLRVNYFAQEMFKYSDFVVLMSATIIDPANFAKQLGIKDYYYIEAPSTFDPKKAPIIVSDKISVSYANKAVTIPKLAQIAKKICDERHHDQKGIIHTHSMEITEIVKRTCKNDPRYLYREVGQNNELILDEHKEREDATVLVSPSMTHGIDLKDELGEFAIIMKAPYLPLGDERVSRLFKEDKDWYTDKMLSSFIQMCGRTIRSKDDESVTYILDGTLSKALSDNSDKLPKYILERIISK